LFIQVVSEFLVANFSDLGGKVQLELVVAEQLKLLILFLVFVFVLFNEGVEEVLVLVSDALVLLDEAESVGLLAGSSDFLVRRRGQSVENVVLDRLIKQDWLLHDEADGATQVFDVVVLEGLAIEEHFALLEVVESEEDLGDCGLAAPRSTDESDLLRSSIFMWKSLRMIWSRDGYLKVTSLNSIEPPFTSWCFASFPSLTSRVLFSSMISKIVFAEALALSTDGRFDIDIPMPMAACISTLMQM